jgi:hypothetical protein
MALRDLEYFARFKFFVAVAAAGAVEAHAVVTRSSNGSSTDGLKRHSCSSDIRWPSSFEAAPRFKIYMSCYEMSQSRTRGNYLT